MDKRYLIKTISVATDKNENFKGTTDITLYGKEHQSIKEKDLSVDFKNEYGYKRLFEAKRVLKRHLEDDKIEMENGYWNIKSKIVGYIV